MSPTYPFTFKSIYLGFVKSKSSARFFVCFRVGGAGYVISIVWYEVVMQYK